MGTMNGALAVTDGSRYVNEIWGKDKALIADLSQFKQLAVQVKELLAQPQSAVKMVAADEQAAREYATVVRRFF